MNIEYSVGIPVRNEEKTIVKNIESILVQTISPSEIHVCVNGSTDHTYNKVADMASTEHKIHLIKSIPGKSNAWNKIVSECITNYVMFCDGDVTLNPQAAENILNEFEENKRLILIGGANAYFSAQNNTIFSKYFTENLKGKPIKQDWVCGRLYMIKLNELYNLAKKCEIELMPRDIINEDGLLELITAGHRKIIDSAYNLSIQVATFHDWKIGFKRVLAGQKQLKQRYPQYFGDSDFSIKRMKNYFRRFNEIDELSKKMGVTSLLVLRTMLNIYYKLFSGLDYSTTWKETKSTKECVE
ncbi:TPA: glycosyltransferase family 2 protein [Candidatus Woesearchaeota archaeon]|nr:glycosyltransferase family 2 protein [Candidatus Woesearchaeota archaeon]HIH31288.1 glycosyltransferase family 2 protein [Candidatus Woesearchaeota archaeon]HIH55577.1 glycosyltransferase family 2 protein [Candidatus Woesearchaeota archaeon]HIJ02106.1 glycosyltransferase family 2 protein [Candidatus Woesearchaeota archaeon]HIJ13670.1 glycosyltransferase family 2 protein [Candidatus Woesearchaeota archaeon]